MIIRGPARSWRPGRGRQGRMEEDGDRLGLLGIDLSTRPHANRLKGLSDAIVAKGPIYGSRTVDAMAAILQMREFSFTADPAKLQTEAAIGKRRKNDRVAN